MAEKNNEAMHRKIISKIRMLLFDHYLTENSLFGCGRFGEDQAHFCSLLDFLDIEKES